MALLGWNAQVLSSNGCLFDTVLRGVFVSYLVLVRLFICLLSCRFSILTLSTHGFILFHRPLAPFIAGRLCGWRFLVGVGLFGVWIAYCRTSESTLTCGRRLCRRGVRLTCIIAVILLILLLRLWQLQRLSSNCRRVVGVLLVLFLLCWHCHGVGWQWSGHSLLHGQSFWSQ